MAGYRRGIRLRGSVVVVTGAGGATARAIARALTGHGARPVLLDPERTDGDVDGWVHCLSDPAGGGLLDQPVEQVRQVLEADVLGAVDSARAAVPRLAVHGGVLVFVVSVHGQVARPFGAPRSMAAAAVRALAGALRQELRLGGVHGVAVTTVLAPDGAYPAGSPERVAATVLRRLRYPALETVAGGPVAKAVVHGHALVPPLTEWLVARRSRGR